MNIADIAWTGRLYNDLPEQGGDVVQGGVEGGDGLAVQSVEEACGCGGLQEDSPLLYLDRPHLHHRAQPQTVHLGLHTGPGQ